MRPYELESVAAEVHMSLRFCGMCHSASSGGLDCGGIT